MLSSGDWTRLQRLRGSRSGTSGKILGSSIIKKPASEFTDLIGFRKVDYLAKSEINSGSNTTKLLGNRLCSCGLSFLIIKSELCSKCKY